VSFYVRLLCTVLEIKFMKHFIRIFRVSQLIPNLLIASRIIVSRIIVSHLVKTPVLVHQLFPKIIIILVPIRLVSIVTVQSLIPLSICRHQTTVWITPRMGSSIFR